MGQIAWNYLGIFLIPIFAGFAARFFCRRRRKTWLMTACWVLLAAAAWLAAATVPNHGSELYGALALMASSVAIASLLTGLVLRLNGRK